MVREGRRLASRLIELERAALVRSYAGLVAAVDRAPGPSAPGGLTR